MKIWSFLAPFHFKNKNSWYFQFSTIQKFQQRFIVSENLTYKSQLFLKLQAVEFGISFLSLSFLRKLTAKKVFGETFKFFDPATTKWRPCKFLAKLNGNHILMANFSKLRKYQTFVLIELRNWNKVQLADRIFKLWKSYIYDYQAVEHTTFEILNF